ncbi:MAG: MinD-like ATPase involved in chromosome partitioning or flagellar assembly [Pontimonas sp.]|jgi:MinD-like ATPase involved in chromosome partitioning or flagellar assembly
MGSTIGAVMSPELWESFVNSTDFFDCEPLWLGRDTGHLTPVTKGLELKGVVVELSPEVCNGTSPAWETLSVVPKAGLPVFSGSDNLAETHGCLTMLTGPEDLTQWISELAKAPSTQPHSNGLGTIVAIVGPPGSPGRTTLAINFAAQCAQLSNYVVLIDADVYSPSVSQLLGLGTKEGGLFSALRSARVENVDIAAVLSHAQQYTDSTVGFTVLTGLLPVQQKKPVDRVAFEKVLDCLKGAGFTVVVDTSAVWSHGPQDGFGNNPSAAPQIVEVASGAADVVIAITHSTDLGISRFVRSWGVLSPRVSHDNFHLVMRDSRHTSARERHDGTHAVWEYTGLEKISVLDDEGAGLWKAQKSKVTLADFSKESSARGIMGALAESIIGRPATKAKKSSWAVVLRSSIAQWLAGHLNRSR